MVYDKLDRLVMQQEPYQYSDGKWTFLKYDAFGREIIKGICKFEQGMTRNDMQGFYNSATEYWELADAGGLFYTNRIFPSSGR
jgi:hypothetical protein